MKIRNGFVSNSSSSSFIVSVKPNNTKCPHCGRGDTTFLSLVESRTNFCDNEIRAEGLEGVLAVLKSWGYDTSVDKNCANLINRLTEEMEMGNTLALIDISDHDTFLSDEMLAQEKSRTLNIIERLD